MAAPTQAYETPWQKLKTAISGAVGGIGSTMAFNSLLSYLVPAATGVYYIPFFAMFLYFGVSGKVTQLLYNLMSYVWDPKDDALLQTTAQALASTKVNESVKAELGEQLRKYKDLRERINQTLRDVNSKKVDPTTGALNVIQLAQHLSRIRIEIARLDGDESARLKELENLQNILKTESQLLNQMRANKSVQRKQSYRAGDMATYQNASKEIDAIDSVQDRIDASSTQVAAAKKRAEISYKPSPPRPAFKPIVKPVLNRPGKPAAFQGAQQPAAPVKARRQSPARRVSPIKMSSPRKRPGRKSPPRKSPVKRTPQSKSPYRSRHSNSNMYDID